MLSGRERAAWQRDGFFVRDAVFGPAELEAFRRVVTRVEDTLPEWSRGGRAYDIDGLPFVDVGDTTLQYEHRAHTRPRVVEPAHTLAPEFATLAADARIADPVRALLRTSQISLFTDKLNWKPAWMGSSFAWHRDAPYWAHLPGVWERVETLVNALVYFDDADRRNGCFRVIAGSHREGPYPPPPETGVLAPLFVDPAALDTGAERALSAAAGSVVFFHSQLVHGSDANHTHRARRAIVFTLQAGLHAMFKGAGVRELR